MCGIVGLLPKPVNGLSWTDQKIFDQMLFANLLRGSDSTGVIGVMADGDFGIMKEASDSYFFAGQFADSDLYKRLYTSGRAVIGHNRAKTIGENKDENAHPFVIDGTFAMVHNGTLRNHKALFDTEVDSEALARLFKEAMDQEDWKKALEDAIGRVSGAFAVIWYDQKRQQLCLLRNSERPLGFCETPDSILIASEIALANWIGTRNGKACKDFKSCAVHTLYTFDMKEGKGALQETNLSPTTPTKTRGFQNGTTKLGEDNLTGGTTASTHSKHDAQSRRIFGPQELSKNAFKRLRARILQKTITFECQDYIPMTGGQFRLLGESTDGAHDICDHNHIIAGTLNGWSHGLEESDFWVNDTIDFTARIVDVEYDPKQKRAEIIVTAIEPTTYVKKQAVH